MKTKRHYILPEYCEENGRRFHRKACAGFLRHGNDLELGYVYPSPTVNCEECKRSESFKQDLITLELVFENNAQNFYMHFWLRKIK